MLKKFLRNYGADVIVGALIAVAFVAGFSVGKAKRVEVPVFVEVPVETTVECEECSKRAEQVEPREAANVVKLTATAYCSCEKCCGVWATKRPLDDNGNPIVYTASGTVAQAGRTIAVDPSVYPYGTVFDIGGVEYVAEDCGGAIKGNRIDVYFDDHQEAREFGRQEVFAIVKGD